MRKVLREDAIREASRLTKATKSDVEKILHNAKVPETSSHT